MALKNEFISSLTPKKANYGSLFSNPAEFKSLSGLKAPVLTMPTLNSQQPKSPVAATPSATPATTPTVVNTTPTKPPVASTTSVNPVVTSSSGKSYIDSLSTPLPNTSNTSSASAPSAATPTTNDPKTAYLDSYRDYLSQYTNSLKPSEEVVAARTKLADIQNKGEAKSLEARRKYEEILDTSGMLKGGAQDAARMDSRRSNQELADIALQESAAARSLTALTGNEEARSTALKSVMELSKPLQIGDSYIDPTTGKIIYEKPQGVNDKYGSGIIGEYNFAKANGYTGSFEQYQNEDANRKKTANSITTTGGGYGGVPGALSPLAQAVQNGTITIDKIPAAQRAQVAAELATSGIATNRQTTLASNLAVVNDLLGNASLGAISGVPALSAFIPGTSAQLAKNQYNQLKGILSLENREKLKGSGAISDFEFRVLSEAATALGRNLSDADFKKQLEKIRDVFEGKYAQTNAGATNGAPLPASGGDAEYQAYLKSINAQ